MRGVTVVALLLAIPMASAEWGAYGEDGWPINVDGESTNPFPGYTAAEADALLDAAPQGEPLNHVAGVTVYPYWPILTAEVLRMAEDHPDRVRLHTAGKSTVGLDLYMLEICDFEKAATYPDTVQGGENDCSAPDGSAREVVWVDGGHHSNEYSGVYFALAYAQWLIEDYGSDETATWIVENRHTWIMPMVNPDGSHAMGRLNANGVNINRNYPVIWDGEGHDATLNNRGPSPASEVETQANIEWFNVTRADYYASVHCCGNLWLYPYGEEGVDPIDNQTLSRVCDEAFAPVRDACGPIWSTIYPASGSSVDTAYEFAGMVAFGYEMSGRGAVSLWGQPLTNEAVRVQEYESWDGLTHAFLNVHRYGAHPVVTDVERVAGGLLVTVHNDGLGDLTRGTIEFTHPYPMAHESGDWEGPLLPPIPSNQSVVVKIPLDEEQVEVGGSVIAIQYAKRLIPTSNIGLSLTPLLVSDDATEAPAGGFAVPASAPSQGADAASPGIGLAATLGLLAAAVVLVRRR